MAFFKIHLNWRPWLQVAGTKHTISTLPKVCISLAQLCYLSTISGFWELQWIIICRLNNTSQTLLDHAIITSFPCVTMRPLIDRETAVNLTCSIIARRLDYCNSVLYSVSETNIAKHQWMQNNLARVVCKWPYNTNVTELLRELHWLPVRHRITYKVTIITYRTQNCQQPGYLLDSIISYKPAKALRS